MIARMVDVPPEPSLSAAASRWVIDEIEVTLWSIDSPTIDTETAAETLSVEERVQAEGYRFSADRLRYINSHMFLRRELAARLGCAPAQVEFGSGVEGKPCLGGRWADAPWHFSLSRSGVLAAVAISRSREVGVDIEEIRPIPNIDELVRRCLSDLELAEYRAVGLDRGLGDFFQLWTYKEAVLKAAGVGLRVDPRTIHIGLNVDPVLPLINIRDIRWQILSAGPVEGYRTAVAAEAR